MARRKIGKENIRKLQRSSGSYLLRLPIRLIRALRWQERQQVVVRRHGKGLLIRDWPLRRAGRFRRKQKKKGK